MNVHVHVHVPLPFLFFSLNLQPNMNKYSILYVHVHEQYVEILYALVHTCSLTNTIHPRTAQAYPVHSYMYIAHIVHTVYM